MGELSSSLELKSKMLKILMVVVCGGVVIIPNNTLAASDLLGVSASGATQNQASIGNAVNTLCPRGGNGKGLQARCDALILGRIGNPIPAISEGPDLKGPPTISDSLLNNVLGTITSEQTAAQGRNAIELSNAQLSNLGARFATIRQQGRQSGVRLSGLMLQDRNGHLLSKNELEKLDYSFNPMAAGDGDSVFDRLGIFINGNIGYGDRNTTINEVGYDEDDYGTTLGMDYRLTDNFVMGVAFGYGHTDTEYVDGLGELDSDAFTGAIYGTYYTDNGFYVDAVFSGSSLEYDTRRNINYVANGDIVNTFTTGKNNGHEFDISLSGGYNYTIGGLTLTPQARFDYKNTQIDALDEVGGSGWAMHIDEQDFDSLTTALGLQASYPFSFSWGVLMPMVRAEWVHEFKNSDRAIQAHFIQDPGQTKFNILTDRPDRDFVNLGVAMSAQFFHGISAFVAYETLIANHYASNHQFTGGVRIEVGF